MAFIKKTWKDRISEYPNRRTLTKSDGTAEIVTVDRTEGAISQTGDAFSAANLNDLEQRVADEFGTIITDTGWIEITNLPANVVDGTLMIRKINSIAYIVGRIIWRGDTLSSINLPDEFNPVINTYYSKAMPHILLKSDELSSIVETVQITNTTPPRIEIGRSDVRGDDLSAALLNTDFSITYMTAD